MSPKENITVLSSFMTGNQMRRLFGRTAMTLYIWRRDKGLPYILIPGEGKPSIRFDLDAVLSWAVLLNVEYSEEVLNELINRTNTKTA